METIIANEKLTNTFFYKRIFCLIAILLFGMVSTVSLADVVNINKANAAALQDSLKGVGKVKAKAIVDYRQKNGPFKNINDLKNVSGIGDELLKKNRKNLSTTKGITKANAEKGGKHSTSSDKSSSKTPKDSTSNKSESRKSASNKSKNKKATTDKRDKKNSNGKQKGNADKKLKKDKKPKKPTKDKQNNKNKKPKKDRKN